MFSAFLMGMMSWGITGSTLEREKGRGANKGYEFETRLIDVVEKLHIYSDHETDTTTKRARGVKVNRA